MTSPLFPAGQRSVVIASRQSADQLDRCLDALRAQCSDVGDEIVVARDPSAGPLSANALQYPGLVVVWSKPGASVPVLRGLGLAASTGDPVAVTEDHLVPGPDWLASLCRALEPGFAGVGGVLVNAARGRLLDWAAYFADYGFFSIGRTIRSDPPLVTAANIGYRRAVVKDAAEWCQAGLWENVVHDRLVGAGQRIGFTRDAKVYHNHRYRFADFWRDRFEHGLDYARSRRAEHPEMNRWTRAIAAPMLLPVLFGRIARDAWREAPAQFWGAAPITVALVSGWVVGELVGYLGPGHRRP